MRTRAKVIPGLLVLLLLVGSSPAFAWLQRHVHVNGVHLSAQEIEALDQTLGVYVRDGAYWFNPRTGAWGFEGNPIPQGHLSGGRASPNTGSSGYNRRGPFGDSMSDGRCAYVNGIPVGNCE